MSESYRRTNEPSGLEVEGSTAGATGDDDLAEVGRLFVEWAVQRRYFTMFMHDDRVPLALASAFKAGWEAAKNG